MDKIRKLEKSIEKKCASEDYEQVNKCIDEIILDKQDGDDIKEIKSLICQLEGSCNLANVYAFIAIIYALFIGAIPLIVEFFGNIASVIIFIMFFVIILGLVALKKITDEYKKAFILKALNFRLEELNNKRKKKNKRK